MGRKAILVFILIMWAPIGALNSSTASSGKPSQLQSSFSNDILKTTISESETQYTNHIPITIENNTDFSIQALNEGWDGNGSSTDPYVIEGLEFSDLSEVLISIKNTDVHFEIRNNLLYGKLQTSIGIDLSNVTNGMISSNEITKCLYSGIILEKSDANEISGNTLTDHGQASQMVHHEKYSRNLCGIYLGSSDSNVIKANILERGNQYGISIYSSASNLVSMNTINDLYTGIGIFEISQYNVISNNSITFTTLFGGIACFLEEPSHNLVTNNTFSNNKEGIRFCGRNNTATDNIFFDNSIAISIGRNYKFNEWKARQSVIHNNMIYNNSIGIDLAFSIEADILNNSIFSNENYGLNIWSGSSTNVIKWNDFLNNNRDGTSQAQDNGNKNTFTSNYWYEWSDTSKPYEISGSAGNTDSSPLASKNNPDSPDILPPKSSSGWLIPLVLPIIFAYGIIRKTKKKN